MSRHISYTFFIFFTSLLFACKKENSRSERFNNLIGRWHLSQRAKDYNNNGVLDSNERTNASNNPATDDEYFADGKGKTYFDWIGNKYTIDFEWSLESTETILKTTSNPGTSNATIQNFPIFSLTSKELALFYQGSVDSGYAIYSKM